MSAAAQAVFYYDLGCPECYLAAERIHPALPIVAEWEPVLGSEFSALPLDRAAVQARAAELGLQALRWPSVLPPVSRDAMLAATYAKQLGRVVAFSLAAFRQAFAAGRDLADRDTVLLAGAASEIHPKALIGALERRSVLAALAHAGERARSAGVRVLPAVVLGEEVFSGGEAVERAAAALTGSRHHRRANMLRRPVDR